MTWAEFAGSLLDLVIVIMLLAYLWYLYHKHGG